MYMHSPHYELQSILWDTQGVSKSWYFQVFKVSASFYGSRKKVKFTKEIDWLIQCATCFGMSAGSWESKSLSGLTCESLDNQVCVWSIQLYGSLAELAEYELFCMS